MDDIQTDVTPSGSEAPAVGAGESTPSAPSPGGVGSEAPVSADAIPVAETVATAPTGETEAPFELPENDDDLRGQEHQPHVVAVKQLRQQLRADREAHQAALTPWATLEQQHGSRDVVERNLGLVDGLFDTVEGKPPTASFVEQLAELSPSTAWQLAEQLLSSDLPLRDGTKVNAWDRAITIMGLDPARMADYQALTKGTYAPPSAIDPEHLAEIADNRKDAFKALDPVQHEFWHQYTDAEKKVFLDKQQKELDNDKQTATDIAQLRAESERRTTEDRQKFQHEVETAQGEAIGAIRSESFGFIMDELQKQWQPSGDPAVNAGAYASIGLACAALIEPAFRGLAGDTLAAAGVKVDFGALDAAVAKLEMRSNDAVLAKKSGEAEKARRAEVDVKNAQRQITAVLSGAATGLAGIRGGALDARRQAANSAIEAAQGARPNISGSPAMSTAAPATRFSGEGKVPGSVWQEVGANSRRSVAQ